MVEAAPGLVESLFGTDIPDRVVVQRFNAFEIWERGASEWVTNWWANDAYAVEGEWAAVWDPARAAVVSVRDPSVVVQAECPQLMSRNDQVLILERCWSDEWRLFEPVSGEARSTPVPFEARGDGESVYFIERATTVVHGSSDAEGNLTGLTTLSGIDVLGDDYAGLAAVSVDGTRFAYVDPADPAAFGHFWSPVVVVRDTMTGGEIGSWTVDDPIGCQEFADSWLVVCEMGEDPNVIDPQQVALVSINVDTGELNRVPTRSQVYLP